MCDFSGKLIAWMDRELVEEESAAVERHLETCSECRSEVHTYKRVSSEFDAYCDDEMTSNVRHGDPRWVPMVSAVGAVAAIVALFFVWPRMPVQPPPFQPSNGVESASAGVIAKGLPAPVRPIQKIHRRQVVTPVQIHNPIVAPVQNHDAYTPTNEPMIQIAIPADEMFPPGAVPEGIHFAADLTIAADGSAERLRLSPELAVFERRKTQP
jgi:anti-sigma factor RsiW